MSDTRRPEIIFLRETIWHSLTKDAGTFGGIVAVCLFIERFTPGNRIVQIAFVILGVMALLSRVMEYGERARTRQEAEAIIDRVFGPAPPPTAAAESRDRLLDLED